MRAADEGISPSLPACLGFVAGMVDVTGWLTLGGLFTAHITGNLVVLAADLVDGRAMHPAQLLAIPMFVAVTAILAVVVRRASMTAATIRVLLLGLQSILLVVAAVLALATAPSHAPFALAAGIVTMLAVAAMASQNALLHLSIKPTPTTAVMTGNVVACTLSLVSMILYRPSDYDAAKAQWRATWPILAGFLLGCAAGSACVFAFADGAWAVAACASIAAAIGLRAQTFALSDTKDQ